jgi:predicted  nucleic acid-binding Zn-ribbon protein
MIPLSKLSWSPCSTQGRPHCLSLQVQSSGPREILLKAYSEESVNTIVEQLEHLTAGNGGGRASKRSQTDNNSSQTAHEPSLSSLSSLQQQASSSKLTASHIKGEKEGNVAVLKGQLTAALLENSKLLTQYDILEEQLESANSKLKSVVNHNVQLEKALGKSGWEVQALKEQLRQLTRELKAATEAAQQAAVERVRQLAHAAQLNEMAYELKQVTGDRDALVEELVKVQVELVELTPTALEKTKGKLEVAEKRAIAAEHALQSHFKGYVVALEQENKKRERGKKEEGEGNIEETRNINKLREAHAELRRTVEVQSASQEATMSKLQGEAEGARAVIKSLRSQVVSLQATSRRMVERRAAEARAAKMARRDAAALAGRLKTAESVWLAEKEKMGHIIADLQGEKNDNGGEENEEGGGGGQQPSVSPSDDDVAVGMGSTNEVEGLRERAETAELTLISLRERLRQTEHKVTEVTNAWEGVNAEKRELKQRLEAVVVESRRAVRETGSGEEEEGMAVAVSPVLDALKKGKKVMVVAPGEEEEGEGRVGGDGLIGAVYR